MIQLPPRPQINAAANPMVTRIIPELAKEIGLNESIILLQVGYWITTASDDNFKDGLWWTYQSVRDMQSKAFPYWSHMTINRAIQELVKTHKCLIEGNYNKESYDKTRWLALNTETINRLHSISVTTLSRVDTPLYQNVTPTPQIVTPIPENTTEIKDKEIPSAMQKVKQPRKRSAAQLANDEVNALKILPLEQALGIPAAKPDVSLYLKIVNDLISGGVPETEFGDYVKRIRRIAKEQNWKVTLPSLTANGRISEYVTARNTYRQTLERQVANGAGKHADYDPYQQRGLSLEDLTHDHK